MRKTERKWYGRILSGRIVAWRWLWMAAFGVGFCAGTYAQEAPAPKVGATPQQAT